MKNNRMLLHPLWLILALTLVSLQPKAQPTLTDEQAARLVEKTLVITDRQVYCVQEHILFSAFNTSSAALQEEPWSQVLYLELVSPQGQTFARGKYAYGPRGGQGSLQIPRETLTGNYYLRAYTRWMRDYPPAGYYTLMITVINPFRPELLEATGTLPARETGLQKAPESPLEVRLQTDQKSYAKGQQVNLQLSALSTQQPQHRLTVSVIPRGAYLHPSKDLTRGQEPVFSPSFIPETRGLSLSGTVINQQDSLPLSYTLVGLTIFKDNPESRLVRTNEKGQFFFDLSTLSGEYEIFISAKSNGKQQPGILVDNDFSSSQQPLPYVPVDLSPEAQTLYRHLSFNSQINEQYSRQQREQKTSSEASDTSFYGAPDAVLHLKEFIAMATLQDYITELIPQVGVRQQDKKTVLKVLGPHAELSFYEPMVLIDRIPVFDIDRLLAIPPQKIERIEVVSLPYVRGDILFGGIISFFSKKGDLAGIDIPSSGRFITYSMLNEPMPQGPVLPSHPRIPHLPNCLYWNPSLLLQGVQPATVSFSAGEQPGHYQVVVQGVDKDNHLRVSTHEFMVE